MANFGVRLATPLPPRRIAAPHGTVQDVIEQRPRGMAARVRAFVRRVVQGALQALDDAPYDLAWPPSPRAAAMWARRREEERSRAAATTGDR